MVFFTFTSTLFTFFKETHKLGTKMIIVIDGYNVLKQNLKQTHITDQAKQHFFVQLNNYSNAKGHAIVVVFDGGPYWGTDTEKIGGITVVHSGSKESADDYIMRYLDTHKGKELLLISTDRLLCRHAWDLSIESIDAIDFYQLLQEETTQKPAQPKNNQGVIKLTKKNQPELDKLMHEASKQMPPKKNVTADDARSTQRPSKVLSKKERRMLKKIKKL